MAVNTYSLLNWDYCCISFRVFHTVVSLSLIVPFILKNKRKQVLTVSIVSLKSSAGSLLIKLLIYVLHLLRASLIGIIYEVPVLWHLMHYDRVGDDTPTSQKRIPSSNANFQQKSLYKWLQPQHKRLIDSFQMVGPQVRLSFIGHTVLQ